MRHQDTFNYTTNLLARIENYNINGLINIIDEIDVATIELPELFKNDEMVESLDAKSILIQLKMCSNYLQDINNDRSATNRMMQNPQCYFDWRKESTGKYLTRFLFSDYFRTEQEKLYNDTRVAATFFIHYLKKYNGSKLNWNFMNKFDEVINYMKLMNEDVFVLNNYKTEILSDVENGNVRYDFLCRCISEEISKLLIKQLR